MDEKKHLWPVINAQDHSKHQFSIQLIQLMLEAELAR